MVILLIMKISWKVAPASVVSVAYVDKTDVSGERLAHNAFFWVLQNQQMRKQNGKPYDKTTDYWGVFSDKSGSYRFKDFDQLSQAQLDSLSRQTDILMFADTYGVYAAEAESEGTELIYGGMTSADISLFRKMKKEGKTIVAEFNILQAPTARAIRRQFEEEAGLHWTGWSGKYFESLNQESETLPAWVIRSYNENYHEAWEYHGAGIVLINEDGRMVVLSEKNDLNTAMPQIKTFGYGVNQLELPRLQEFPYWFDVIEYNDSINHAISAYQIDLTDQGKTKLNQLGISDRFPAVLMHRAQDYSFYYLCGDYSSEPISMATSRFKGIEHFSSILKGRKGTFGEDEFFYRFYFPLMRNILREHNHPKPTR
jgi:hypothetical protein